MVVSLSNSRNGCFTLPGKNPLNRRLGGPQKRFGSFVKRKKPVPLSEFRINQEEASRHIDYATVTP